MQPETLALIRQGDAKKGDVLGTARLAGIMAAKTHPRAHPALPSAAALEGERGLRARRQRCRACA